jgi:hypothetical protein
MYIILFMETNTDNKFFEYHGSTRKIQYMINANEYQQTQEPVIFDNNKFLYGTQFLAKFTDNDNLYTFLEIHSGTLEKLSKETLRMIESKYDYVITCHPCKKTVKNSLGNWHGQTGFDPCTKYDYDISNYFYCIVSID